MFVTIYKLEITEDEDLLVPTSAERVTGNMLKFQ